MLKGVAVSSIVLSTALAMTGCMTKQGDVGNKNIRPNSYKMQGLNGTRFANDGANEANRIRGTQQMNNNLTGLHGNTRMEMSQKIADKLAALPEIKSAFVVLTNRNAYVAIVEDKNGVRTHLNRNKSTVGTQNAHGISRYSTGGSALPDRGTGLNNPNTFRSHYGVKGHHYHPLNMGSTVPRTGMKGAGGLTAGGTGQSGTAGTTNADVSDMIKNKVADIVKGMEPTVENVYVSANPDFYGRVQTYAADVTNGRPIQGLIAQFNALVERIFPQAAGTGTQLPAKTAPHYYAPTAPSRSGTLR
ncbi:YhcN/YlaJ family sporulation lipoprotein [Cohnella thermotolerans]|uniref:YhcN/YlaJ family sporulation lipoprotein n=1 Tax=Cohnella thermotolerans TaxID=329858 RepID=UPI00042512C3|nr:YhcN/YlaJ family sporulation lipoprotein [Cohnella thermotolerans]